MKLRISHASTTYINWNHELVYMITALKTLHVTVGTKLMYYTLPGITLARPPTAFECL